MKEAGNTQLESIRRLLRAILGVLLLMFGYDHTPFRNTEAGALIAIIALVAGVSMFVFAIVTTVYRFLITFKVMADGEEKQ